MQKVILAGYYGGCEHIDVIERIAQDRACELFGAEHANVQPHSGAQTNFAAYYSVLNLRDTILAMSLNSGGHLTHSSAVSYLYNVIPYNVNRETELIDYDEVRLLAKTHKPKLIVAGASAYSCIIDFKKFREIADEVGAYLMVDMAHIAGLVAAGLHPSPVPYADIITTTTHKTLRGPRGGMILCKKELAKKVDSAVFPRLQGGPLEHIIAAKAVCLGEALKPEFVEYQKQVVANAKRLANDFIAAGIHVVADGTDNHLMLLDLTGTDATGKGYEEHLDKVNITVNKNAIPYDSLSPSIASGIRIGTPAVTTRGMKEKDMDTICCFMLRVLENIEDPNIIKMDVLDFMKQFPLN